MIRIIFILVFMLSSSSLYAEQIKLKSGKILEGEILELQEDYVILKSEGKNYKISFKFLDESTINLLANLPQKIRPKKDVIYVGKSVGKKINGLSGDKDTYNAEQDRVMAYLEAGMKSSFEGKNEEALKQYQKALEIDPNNSVIYGTIGFHYFGLGKLSEAISSYKKAIEVNPNDPQGYAGLAMCYSELREYSLAVKNYNKVLEVDPYGELAATAYFSLGTMYGEMKKFNEANVNLKKARELFEEQGDTEKVKFVDDTIKLYLKGQK